MIKDIIKTPLKQFHDDRGKVMHMLRSTDKHFQDFGEVYFSWVYPHAIKAWHKHVNMIMNYAVPVGYIKLVLYDDRKDSPTYGEINEFYMNSEDYYLLTIPNGLWYGFRAVGTTPAMIVNCSTIPHDPTEIIRIHHDDPLIPYNWDIQHG
ncbi:MAG: dTDP-4-dehydrorhamnose 3,5-epimerase family protein [Candidatus Paracaedibacteraceae bacterium]|nr:dTDP-4-dehydrorhamnose 3,5-epimerase family protein [Candidatus Paracaedibacteraceae bacterium]